MINYEIYDEILKSELVVATGCTEPIAISFAANTLRRYLGKLPQKVTAYICGNIIKNAKSVTVPNTKGLKGIKTAIACGLVLNECEQGLELLESLEEKHLDEVNFLLEKNIIDVNVANTCKSLYIKLIGEFENNKCEVILEDLHNNITFVKLNDKVLIDRNEVYQNKLKSYEFLNIKDIYEYASTCNLDNIKDSLKRQIDYNFKIAQEGISGKYGASIGYILNKNATSIKEKAKAYTAAASDARMAGATLPVVIISGSGNQGITASVPLVVYAKEYNISEEKLLRSLILSDLVILQEKKDIGRLSAFCGAISAGVGAVAGICYMFGGSLEAISHTIVNSLAISSGVICDGAKSSCAAKIALSLESGFIGYEMYQEDKEFKDGEGIVLKGVDNTIRNVGRLASKGMKETDKEIISMMIGK